MKFLYLSLDLGSLIIPLLFSFHPKIKFYQKWKLILPGILIMSIIFIVWDIIFTNKGVWGFREEYLIGVEIFNLPIEEWLFFLCVPYACLFTHFTLKKLWYKEGLNNQISKYISYSIILVSLIFAFGNIDKDYTFYNFIVCGIVVAAMYFVDSETLNTFYISFIIILLPFFMVNGILTGSFIDNEVVWYNNHENLGIRIFTIPVEDVFYALSMIMMPLLIIELIRRKSTR